MAIRLIFALAVLAAGTAALVAQEAQPETAQAQEMARQYVIPARTRIPLVLVNSVSTKTSEPGDQVYLQTAFPIFANGRIVIPEGSYVTGTITQVKRPGRIKGRGELYVRFDTLALRNGVSRDFRGTVSATDGSQSSIAEKEGVIEAEGSKGNDAGSVAGGAIYGTQIGTVIGAVNDSPGKGAAIGAAAGAAAGMIGVLLTRGSEVVLLRGTSLEMELDRDLVFYGDEISFVNSTPPQAPPPAPLQAPAQGNPMERRGQSPFPSPFPRF